ncbi:TauD/TfdA family dioxygenase [Actinoplanes sp. NPDC049548]|uniref:TauD/TfdA family dioxygenase n=1 Tax=Actinoplanes sp. NPDC049548 TaxID=3155152 RepID=UPI003415F6C7
MSTNVMTAQDCRTAPGRPASVRAPSQLPADDALAWLRESRPVIMAALQEHGALHLEGLPIRTAEDFARARDVLLTEPASYQEKATPRSDFGGGVFSSTDLPPAQPIRQHNENSYTLTFPGLLLFGCLVAPADGGATPVADCRKVLEAIPEALLHRFRTHGWALTRTYSDTISLDWRTALGVDTDDAALRYCEEHRIAPERLPDGAFRTTQTRSAVIHHPVTGEAVWFNHAAFWSEWSLDPAIREVLVDELGPERLPFNTSFGDGEPLRRADVDALNAAYELATVRAPWSVGDLLLVDNVLCAHGREAYRGDRRIVVAMGQPTAVADCAPTVPATAGLRR